MGHQEGVETVKRITEACVKLGVNYVTLYTFSTENWTRPADEVAALMSLVLSAMEEELFMKNNVKLRLIGDLSRVPENVREAILNLQERTQVNTGMTMVIALSYSSRWEITDTVKRLAEKVTVGELAPEDITEEMISGSLYTKNLPDPDLIIRPSGEYRLSNFLTWQSAYAEFWFSNVLWPDFTEEDLIEALRDFEKRNRRFGGV